MLVHRSFVISSGNHATPSSPSMMKWARPTGGGPLTVQDVTSDVARSAGVSPTWPQSGGALPTGEAFDWQGDQPLRLPQVPTTDHSIQSKLSFVPWPEPWTAGHSAAQHWVKAYRQAMQRNNALTSSGAQ